MPRSSTTSCARARRARTRGRRRRGRGCFSRRASGDAPKRKRRLETEREATRAAAAAERRGKVAAEGRAFEGDAAAGVSEGGGTESEAPSPPMDDAEKRAAWCAAAGPGATSAAAVELLKKRDLEGKDVAFPAMAAASGVGGAAALLGIATRKWFDRHGFKDCRAVVMM